MQNDSDNQVNKMADDMNEAAKSNVQGMQDAAKHGAQKMQAATQQGVQQMQAVTQQGVQQMQDMGRKGAEASMAGMAEFSRMFSEMKWPMMPDMESLMAAHKRNMETLSAANRVALEGAQTVAKRHMEIVQQTMQEMTDTIRDLSSESPQNRAAKQAEMVKNSYERAVSHMRELADLIQRSNGEALQMLNKRFAEAMDEVKALAAKTGTATGTGV